MNSDAGICQYALVNGCSKLDCIGCEYCPHPAILEPEDNGICMFCEQKVIQRGN